MSNDINEKSSVAQLGLPERVLKVRCCRIISRWISCLLVFGFGCGMTQETVEAETLGKAKVLFVTQSVGYRHKSVTRAEGKLSTAELAMRQLSQQTGLFHLYPTQDVATDFVRGKLDDYDIVMFYTTGDLPIAGKDLDYFFNTWLKQKGHGFIGFHSAADTYKEYQPYWEMIGGTFNGHPWNSNTTVTISVHDPEHPAMVPLESEFSISDEIYWYKNWQPEKVRVLMSLNMAKCDPKKSTHVPVAWVKEWGDGKVFFNNLGHNATTWTDQRFLKSTRGAIRWILGLEEGDATPNPEISKAEQAKAQIAADG